MQPLTGVTKAGPSGAGYLLPTRFPTVMVFWAKTHSAPVVTARLAKKAILAWMLLKALMLFFRNINFSL
jgi:hypothetical protein